MTREVSHGFGVITFIEPVYFQVEEVTIQFVPPAHDEAGRVTRARMLATVRMRAEGIGAQKLSVEFDEDGIKAMTALIAAALRR